MKPKLSIGLPVYNGERYLGSALEALLGQTFGQFEIVLCDNASTDGTADIAARYARADARVRVHRNRRNVGGAPNFNLTFALSSGPFFKWAAHDDLHRPDYLAECMAVVERDDSVVLCHSEVELIDGDGNVTGPHDEGLTLVGSACPAVRFRDLILGDHWCTDVFGVMRRSALARTPLIASYVGSDRNLLAELGLLGRYHRVQGRLFQNRDHAERSVNATDVRSPDRATWFDPKLRGKVSLPFFRSWYEYLAAVQRAPLSARQRRDCYAALAAWLPPNRWRLRQDAEHAARHWLRSLASRQPQATS
jgi:glycosyltransferase involved in cell wall biosynthesis